MQFINYNLLLNFWGSVGLKLMNDDIRPGYFFAGFLTATLVLLIISSGYEKGIEKKVIKACIEQPKVCKVKYDYYNLKS